MSDPTQQGDEGRDGAARWPGVSPQAVRRELWLDLEDTIVTPIIEGWHLFEIINLDKIKKVISDFKPSVLHIFSFAVHDTRQRQLFSTYCRPHLERELGAPFNLVLSVDDDIIPICCRQMGISPQTVDFQEMSSFWSKQGAFRLCMRHHATNFRRHHPNLPLHVLLLDDAVYNECTVWPDLQVTVEQRNIDQL